MSEDERATILRLQANVENLQKDLRAMRIGRENDDLQWRKLWEKEKTRADRLAAKLKSSHSESEE